jgi:hypothetical protein
MKFPAELDLPVNVKKVNWPVMSPWIAKRVTELLGIEDEVLIGTIFNELQDNPNVSRPAARAGRCGHRPAAAGPWLRPRPAPRPRGGRTRAWGRGCTAPGPASAAPAHGAPRRRCRARSCTSS